MTGSHQKPRKFTIAKHYLHVRFLAKMDIDLQEFPQNSICMTGSRQETNHKTLFAYPVLAKMDKDCQIVPRNIVCICSSSQDGHRSSKHLPVLFLDWSFPGFFWSSNLSEVVTTCSYKIKFANGLRNNLLRLFLFTSSVSSCAIISATNPKNYLSGPPLLLFLIGVSTWLRPILQQAPEKLQLGSRPFQRLLFSYALIGFPGVSTWRKAIITASS